MTVTLSGLASGIDTTSIVQQLVAADSGTLNALEQQDTDTADANTTVSAVGTALSTLSTAAAALADSTSNGSFSATSTDTSMTVTTDSTAQPGTYSVKVNAVAQAQRTYSASFASGTTALGQTGSFSIGIGTATPTSIAVDSTDSLQSIVSKINNAGLQVAASVFNDGTTSRLQIRGLATGAANSLNFVETGTSLDLNGTGSTPTSGKTVQTAQDSSITVDGFNVTRPTNQISDAVTGVTVQVTNVTSSAATINVASNSDGLETKLNAVVSAYNAVIKQVHTATGYGSSAASNHLLAGDTTLRSVASTLASDMEGTSTQSGTLTSLADIGLTLQEDGSLALDTSKLDSKFSTDPLSVQKLLGRLHNTTTGGLLAKLNDDVTLMTQSGGVIPSKTSSLTSQKTDLDSRITDEQTRLTSYQTQLQQQFSAMETTYSQNQSLLAQVQKL